MPKSDSEGSTLAANRTVRGPIDAVSTPAFSIGPYVSANTSSTGTSRPVVDCPSVVLT